MLSDVKQYFRIQSDKKTLADSVDVELNGAVSFVLRCE